MKFEYKDYELSNAITDIAAGPFGSNLKVSCFTTTGFPIIDGANLKEFTVTDNITKFVSEDKARSLHRSIAKRRDVVVTISGNVGQVSYIPDNSQYAEYLCSQRQFRATFDESKIYVPYLVYYLHSVEGQSKILAFANQTGVPALSQPLKNFRKIKIDLPSLAEQKKIAAILSALDEKIATNRAINDNLQQQAALLFDENYSNNDYDISPLEAIATIKYGKGLPTKYLTFQGYPVFGGNGVIGSYTYFMYKEPQVLVSCRGAASGNIMESYPNSFITNNSLVLEWNDYRYYEFYKQFLFANPLYSYATGSAQPQITIENIRNVPVPFPNYDEISDLCSILRSISVLHYENIVENNKLVTLRDTLLPRLMSGEIDVSAVQL